MNPPRLRLLQKKLAEVFLLNTLVRHTASLFMAMMVVHVCNLIYQMAVSRALPPREYALLMTFLGVLTIISRPLSTLTTGVSYYSRLLHLENRTGDIRRLLRKWVLLTGIPAFGLGVVAVVFNRPLAGLLNLHRFAPVLIAGVVLPSLFWLPILNGAMQGLQRFGWCSGATIAGALVRLALGAGFVWFVYPACGWAMLGHGLGLYTSVTLLGLGLLLALRGHQKGSLALPSMRLYLLQSFLIQTAYAVLMTADIILVKHYFPDETGFAYVATLSRMVVFLTAAVATAMFPQVTSRASFHKSHKKVLLSSLILTLLCAAVALGGCWVMSAWLLRFLFKIQAASVEMTVMLRGMAFVMTGSALLNTVLQFLLAQRRFAVAAWTVPAAVGYLLCAGFFHESVRQIILFAGIFNFGVLIICLVHVLKLRCAD